MLANFGLSFDKGGFEGVSGAGSQLTDMTGADGASEQFAADGGGLTFAESSRTVEQSDGGLESRTSAGFGFVRTFGTGADLAGGTGQAVKSIFGDEWFDGRKFPSLMTKGFGILAAKSMTAGATGIRAQIDDLIGRKERTKMAVMAGLSAWSFAGFGRRRGGFDGRRIGGGRLVRVGGIESEASLEISELSFECSDASVGGSDASIPGSQKSEDGRLSRRRDLVPKFARNWRVRGHLCGE
jgi:hypothetical protein